MKTITLFSLVIILLSGAIACKKQTEPGIVVVDSMEMHLVGGLAGFTEHYRLNHFFGKKGRPGNEIIYDKLMPIAKYKAIKGVLTHIPQAILTDNMPVAVQYPGIPDANTASWLVFYKDSRKYTYYLSDSSFPDYYSRIDNAWAMLLQ